MDDLVCEMGCKWLQGQAAVPRQAVISVIDGRTVVLCTECHNDLARARYDHPSFRETEKLTARREVILAALTSSAAGSSANLIEESVTISERLAVLKREMFDFIGTWMKATANMKSP